MYYVLVDSEGNRLGASHDEQAVIDELRALVEEDGEDADHLLLLTYGENGRLEGPTRTLDDLPARPETPAERFVSIVFAHEPSNEAISIDWTDYIDWTDRGLQAATVATGVRHSLVGQLNVPPALARAPRRPVSA